MCAQAGCGIWCWSASRADEPAPRTIQRACLGRVAGRSNRDELAAADTHRDEMAFWMYSSGSTGRPKGVVHLHHDAAYTYRELWTARARHARERHRVLAAQDLLRVRLRQLAHLSHSRSVRAAVLHPGRPDPESVLAAIERDRPTILFGLPTLYSALLVASRLRARDLSSLRLCVSAAEVLSSEMFREWQRRYGLSIVEGLGSTEVLHMYLSNRIDQQKPGASGARVPGYEIKLTDIDGNPVPARRVRRDVGARRFGCADVLESSGQDAGDDARGLDLDRRPLPRRRGRLLLSSKGVPTT